MLLRTSSGTIYKAHFRHLMLPHEVADPKHMRPMTQCLLHKLDCRLDFNSCRYRDRRGTISDVTLVSQLGEARCSPLDTFNKQQGRIIALHRALQRFVFDREVRRQLMDDYFRQVGGV